MNLMNPIHTRGALYSHGGPHTHGEFRSQGGPHIIYIAPMVELDPILIVEPLAMEDPISTADPRSRMYVRILPITWSAPN